MAKKTVVTIEEFKAENTRLVQSMLTMQGYMVPLITGLIIRPNGEYNIAIYPLPGKAFESDENKKKIPKVVKILFEKFKKDGITPVCFSFTSEAWLRVLSKEDKIPDDWKSLPSKEAFMTNYETAEDNEVQIHLIHREGKIADKKGKLIDAIRLEKLDDMDTKNPTLCGGLFMNMFRDEIRKFKKDEDNNNN